MVNSDNIKLINLINLLGFNVLEIADRLYVTISFDGFSQHAPFSTLKGRDITALIEDNQIMQSGNIKQQQDQISTKIESLPIVNKQFSNQYSYIWHFSS